MSRRELWATELLSAPLLLAIGVQITGSDITGPVRVP